MCVPPHFRENTSISRILPQGVTWQLQPADSFSQLIVLVNTVVTDLNSIILRKE